MNDDLRVASSGEVVTERLQLFPQLAKIVDLAVEHHPYGPILVMHRLAPGFQVDNAQAPHPQAGVGTHIEPLVIRPARHDSGAQVAQFLFEDRLILEAYDAGDSAHARPAPFVIRAPGGATA